MPVLPGAGRTLVPYFSSSDECVNETLSKSHVEAARCDGLSEQLCDCTCMNTSVNAPAWHIPGLYNAFGHAETEGRQVKRALQNQRRRALKLAAHPSNLQKLLQQSSEEPHLVDLQFCTLPTAILK